MDVALSVANGCIEIQTFDPQLLPSYCDDEFLEQLFLWSLDEGCTPLSIHGNLKVILQRPLGRGRRLLDVQGSLDVLHLFICWLDECRSTREAAGLE